MIVKFVYVMGRMLVACSLSFVAWLFLFFGFGQPFWLSAALALAGGGVVFGALTAYARYAFLKKHQLTRKEYAYIRRNLREAQGKIRRLQKAFVQVRSIQTFRQMLVINRLARRIYTIVKREPKRFYLAERFFFYHLDSLVELTEKHAFLAAQSVNDDHLLQSLRETSRMIDQLIATVEKDLATLLSTDVEHLQFELDVAKRTIHTWAPPLKEGSSDQ